MSVGFESAPIKKAHSCPNPSVVSLSTAQVQNPSCGLEDSCPAWHTGLHTPLSASALPAAEPKFRVFPRARCAPSGLRTLYFMFPLLGTSSSPTVTSLQRVCFSLELSSNVAASAKPPLASLGECEHFLHCDPPTTFSSRTERSVCSLCCKRACLPSQPRAPWRAPTKPLSVWIPVSNSGPSTRQVINKCLLNAKRQDLEEGKGRTGMHVSFPYGEGKPGESWKEVPIGKAWLSALLVEGLSREHPCHCVTQSLGSPGFCLSQCAAPSDHRG